MHRGRVVLDGQIRVFYRASSRELEAPKLDRRAKAVVGETTRGAKRRRARPKTAARSGARGATCAGPELERDPFAGAATDSEDDGGGGRVVSPRARTVRTPRGVVVRLRPPARAARASSVGDRPVHPARYSSSSPLSLRRGPRPGVPPRGGPEICRTRTSARSSSIPPRVASPRLAAFSRLCRARRRRPGRPPRAAAAAPAAERRSRRRPSRAPSGVAATLAFGAGTNGGLLGRAAVARAGGAVSVARPRSSPSGRRTVLRRGPAIACVRRLPSPSAARAVPRVPSEKPGPGAGGEENLPTTAAPHWRGAAPSADLERGVRRRRALALGARRAARAGEPAVVRGARAERRAARHAVAAGWGLRADDPRAEAEAERLVREVRRGRARAFRRRAVAAVAVAPRLRGGLSRPTLSLALVATAQLSGPDLGAYGEAAFASSAARVAGVLAGAATLAYHPGPALQRGERGREGRLRVRVRFGFGHFGFGFGFGRRRRGFPVLVLVLILARRRRSPIRVPRVVQRRGVRERRGVRVVPGGRTRGAPEPGGSGASFAALFAFAHAFGLAHIPWLHVSESFRFDRRASATASLRRRALELRAGRLRGDARGDEHRWRCGDARGVWVGVRARGHRRRAPGAARREGGRGRDEPRGGAREALQDY